MTSLWKKQSEIEKQTNPEMFLLIEKYLGEKIYPATIKQDCTQGFDAISESGLKISIRVRTPKYKEFFGLDFSIRYKTNDGAKTEWNKIIDIEGHQNDQVGLCDIMFYSLMNDSGGIEKLIAINLKAVRVLYEIGMLDYKIKDVGESGNSMAIIKINDFIIYKRKGE